MEKNNENITFDKTKYKINDAILNKFTVSTEISKDRPSVQQKKQIDRQKKEDAIFKLFQKQNPLSLNNKSIYKQDYQSILNKNWLRTQVIGSIITLLQKQYEQKLKQLIRQNNYDSLKNKAGKARIQKMQTIQGSNQISNLSEQQILIQQKFGQYVRVIDPFIVTMILFTQEDFILQTLQGLNIFKTDTKYICFPMNTEYGSGSHWFLIIVKNPLYELVRQINSEKIKQKSKVKAVEMLIANSISSSHNDASLYMANELGQQIIRLLKLFHPQSYINQVKIQKIQHISRQSNSYDCGIFTVAFIQLLMFNIAIQKQIQHILKFRSWLSDQKQINNQQSKQISMKTEFILPQSSLFLRRHYQKLLQNQIINQNQGLILF